MAIELEYICGICAKQAWVPEGDVPDECPDCESERLEINDERERNESNGFCSIGDIAAPHDEINCGLVAMFEADVKRSSSGDVNTRKVCEEHANLWRGSEFIVEMREL